MAIRFHFPTRWLPSGGSKINFSMSNKTNNVASDSGSPTGNGSEAKPADLQLMDHHEPSPTPPASHSPRPHQDANACGVVNSQDQSHSSESGQDECRGRSIDQGQPETMFSQPDRGHPTVEVPYGVSDPYLGGLLTAYGHQALMGYEMPGMASNRVALPLNLADDGPIYVNAKQYHGILRRRQSRARLEAQNKLVKTRKTNLYSPTTGSRGWKDNRIHPRKPYLHESRHLHALSRVRGTGGRFLSTKKTQPANMASQQNHGLGGDNHHFGPTTTLFEIASASHGGGSMYLNPDRTSSRVFGSMSSTVQQTGGLMFGASGHRSSSVR